MLKPFFDTFIIDECNHDVSSDDQSATEDVGGDKSESAQDQSSR